ncbi:hypothetical protein [Desulfotignum balticum]|uniref:hypothetical protein n=1 Tax=Desulfotignum balticum TaxID=115781 RepID=UPI00338EE22F
MIITEVRKIVRGEIEPFAAELDQNGGFPEYTVKCYINIPKIRSKIPIWSA